VALGPGRLVHPQHRTDEHVPRAGQHHHEPVHRPQPARGRVQPPAQLPVIHLRLLARLGRVRVQHPHLRPADFLRHVRRHIPAQARHAHRQPVLITQPLMNRRHRHPGLQLLTDELVMLADRRPGHLPQPGIGQLREPPTHQLGRFLRRPGRAARRDACCLCRSDVLTQRLAVHAQARGHLVLRPARMPVHQNLGHVDHVETPPRHQPPVLVPDGRKVAASRWPGPPRHARHPHGELRDRGGELRDRHQLTGGELLERRHRGSSPWRRTRYDLGL
jgi:hypothetical protein